MTDIIGAVSSDELKKKIPGSSDSDSSPCNEIRESLRRIRRKAKPTKCEELDSILPVADDIISKTEGESDLRDAALIMVAHKKKHYKIKAYESPLEL